MVLLYNLSDMGNALQANAVVIEDMKVKLKTADEQIEYLHDMLTDTVDEVEALKKQSDGKYSLDQGFSTFSAGDPQKCFGHVSGPPPRPPPHPQYKLTTTMNLIIEKT